MEMIHLRLAVMKKFVCGDLKLLLNAKLIQKLCLVQMRNVCLTIIAISYSNVLVIGFGTKTFKVDS